jgi:hypothetical protein
MDTVFMMTRHVHAIFPMDVIVFVLNATKHLDTVRMLVAIVCASVHAIVALLIHLR